MTDYDEMEEMDKWALHRLQEIIRRVSDAYERYQFHVVFYTLYNYCTVDLSALYLDILKDRLYDKSRLRGAPFRPDSHLSDPQGNDPPSGAYHYLHRGVGKCCLPGATRKQAFI